MGIGPLGNVPHLPSLPATVERQPRPTGVCSAELAQRDCGPHQSGQTQGEAEVGRQSRSLVLLQRLGDPGGVIGVPGLHRDLDLDEAEGQPEPLPMMLDQQDIAAFGSDGL